MKQVILDADANLSIKEKLMMPESWHRWSWTYGSSLV